MFTTNSLCLTVCPINEWRPFCTIFKSNLSSFALWKTSSFGILSVQFVFNILLQLHVSNTFTTLSSFFPTVLGSDPKTAKLRIQRFISFILISKLRLRENSSWFSILNAYLHTPWRRVLEKLTGLQLVKKFPAFHGTRRFITALTSVRHLSLFWASSIQSIPPHPTSWRYILILSSHLRLGLPSDLLPSGFPNKTLYTTLSSTIRATCPANLIFLDFITRTILGDEYNSFSSSLCNLLHII